MATCPMCNGRTTVNRSFDCEVCEGLGQVEDENGEWVSCPAGCYNGTVVIPVSCPTCGGSGEVEDD